MKSKCKVIAIFFLIALISASFLFGTSYGVFAEEGKYDDEYTFYNTFYNEDVWSYRIVGFYNETTSYGDLNVCVSAFKLNDEYNSDSNYNYFLIDQTSYQSLDDDHNEVEYKLLFNNIKFMWLNIGVDFVCQVDSVNEDQVLSEYSPGTIDGDTEYTISVYEDKSYYYSKSVKYKCDNRYVMDYSNSNGNYYATSYVYDCFTIGGTPAWTYLKNKSTYKTAKSVWTNTSGKVEHSSNYSKFLNRMVETSVFVVAVPKSYSYFQISLSCTSNQLYIDYDYVNSYNFESVTATTSLRLSNK